MTGKQRDLHEYFARALAASNPFRGNRVSEPNDVEVDVGKIHEREYRRILRAVEAVRTGRHSLGLMLLGPSGVGKSHLLGRLYGWARRERWLGYVFLHNLQASPERMPRYLLKATVSSLCAYRGGSYGTARLYSLLLSALPPHARHTPIEQRIRELGGDNALDRAIYAVLVGFMEALQAADESRDSRELVHAAVEWLSGDVIDEDDAQLLSNLTGHTIAASLPDNHAVERAFIVLSELLARDDKALVLCLDQIDNLDANQVGALSAFLHALIDHSNNLLVICSGVTSSIERLRDQHSIPEAAWDRLAEERVDLTEISVPEARSIVASRCERFCEPFMELNEVAEERRRDALFPLAEGWWRSCVGSALQVRPRDAISWARRAWEEQQNLIEEGGIDAWIDARSGMTRAASAPSVPPETSLDERVLGKLQELVARRLLDSASLPPDGDNLATLTRILLSECAGREEYSLLSISEDVQKKGSPKRFDLIAVERTQSSGQVQTGVLFVTAGQGNAVTNALKRLLDEPTRPEHVLLVTDDRRPFKLGKRGQEHYDALLQRGSQGFQHIKLNLESYAELDALVGLLRQARVGDFEIPERGGFRAVSEREVADTYHRLGRFRSHVLLHDLVTEDLATVVPPAPKPPLDMATVRTAICGILSWKTGAGALELAQKLSEDFAVPRDEALLRQVIDVADKLHEEGLIRSTPQESDRYLWWLGEPK